MINGFVNALLNPGFDYWDFGVGPFTTNNVYTASRWKLALTGTPDVSIQPGTNDGSAVTPKWLRGRPNMTINVNAYNPATDSIQLRQRVEQGTRFGEQCVVLSGIAAGPAGAHFYVAVDNQHFKVETQGQDAGIDVLTHFSFAFTIGAQAQEFLPVDGFTRPSSTGTFKLLFDQAEFSEFFAEPSPFELRNPATERMLLNRYVYPLSRGMVGTTTTTGVHLAVPFPTAMRINPNFRLLKTTGVDLTSMTAGTTTSSSSTINASSTGVSQTGGRLSLLNGWAGLTNGGQSMLATDGIGVYDADY
ncbi:hypothetical protein [Achromobacter insolitus]|uniref:Uncharacterized protein n=1 Tax=Achromobacter insolitus TaxID=217204 RepID=A0A6S7F830_9BURK|nr:hypothetical protein [Achromobacter insolitus]CAB3931656.1 hypothetical protein LMG6000_02263 [Achromobacter insolitus]CAB3939533.1 hypothetical protein LMG5997_04080 [Achromobacter insolitus]